MFQFILPFLVFFPIFLNGLPFQVDLKNADNIDNITFALNLPNNDSVQIGLSFRLLTVSSNINSNNNNNVTTNDPLLVNDVITPTTERINRKKFVSVQEAIEGFRQDLIKKEAEISGIIESKGLFYRHFKLEFDDDKDLTIRCTYDSNYKERSLDISCFEYHEFSEERILSNGEIEFITKGELNYEPNVELVNLKSMRQTYKMNIK